MIKSEGYDTFNRDKKKATSRLRSKKKFLLAKGNGTAKMERNGGKRGRCMVETTMARQHAYAASHNGRARGTVKVVSTVNRGPFRGVAERGDKAREIQTTRRPERRATRSVNPRKPLDRFACHHCRRS